jgi:hypothetical protein
MSVLPASQNKRRALVRTLMFVVGAALVALTLFARFTDTSVHAAVLPVLVAFCVLAVLEFSVFDEFAKQGHYIAWYWGSLIGLVIVAAAQVLLAFDGQPFASLRNALADQLGAADPTEAFMIGMMVTPVLMAAGFFIWRGVSWLRDR